MSAPFPKFMKYVGFLLLALVVIFLVGCASTQKEYVAKPEVRLVETPRHLLTKCPVTAPPARDSFIALSQKEQVDVLSTYTVNLLGDLKNCNDQIAGIATFQANEKKVIADALKDSK